MVKIFVVLLIMSIVCVGKTSEYETVCDCRTKGNDSFCDSIDQKNKDNQKLIKTKAEYFRDNLSKE